MREGLATGMQLTRAMLQAKTSATHMLSQGVNVCKGKSAEKKVARRGRGGVVGGGFASSIQPTWMVSQDATSAIQVLSMGLATTGFFLNSSVRGILRGSPVRRPSATHCTSYWVSKTLASTPATQWQACMHVMHSSTPLLVRIRSPDIYIMYSSAAAHKRNMLAVRRIVYVSRGLTEPLDGMQRYAAAEVQAHWTQLDHGLT